MVCPECAKRRQIALAIPPIPTDTNTMRVIAGRPRSRHVSSCGSASITSASRFIFSFLTFNRQGDPHAAPDAQRSKAAFRVPLLHLMEERDKHTRSEERRV